MAQANRLPSAMRGLITGANQNSSTAHVPGGRDVRWSNAVPGVIDASCQLARRLP
jgi:hypothetical protein